MSALEEWRAVVGFPGYEVSSLGRVRSQKFGSLWTVLRPSPGKRGYLRVAMSRDGKTHRRLVHRVVLEAFRGQCPVGMEARHVNDNNTANNAIDNLAWGTRLENAADRDRHGTTARGDRSGARLHPERWSRGDDHFTRRNPGCRAGSKNGRAKLDEDAVRRIRAEWEASCKRKGEQMRIARKFGVSHQITTHIIHRKTWRHVE